ncbi:MAG: hypothetical protein Q8Q08_04625 [Candidatus Omnitrophota bacterium]|nr:hypothetical protein [Candidatus Omnitrophota bacterium]MDZ4241356.1 hypothetical protein [Candidatus Omnitrophota bacterium]
MADHRVHQQNALTFWHLPTFFLVIGYPAYWLELFWLGSRRGITSPLGWIVFAVVLLIVLKGAWPGLKDVVLESRAEILRMPLPRRTLVLTAGMILFVLLACAFYASLLPPHLPQEGDALNYHITVPRQHLIYGSFEFLPWSVTDLFLLPLDFALAPFWLSTPTPNKIPQFWFLIGMIAVMARLSGRFTRGRLSPAFWIACAVAGSHNVGIQAGTAMLDLVIVYLFFAAWDSFLHGRKWLCALELTFFIWSKPFIPAFLVISAVLMIAFAAVMSLGGKRPLKFAWLSVPPEGEGPGERWPDAKRVALMSVLLSIFIAGPFLAKSLYYSGTPVYPLAAGRWIVNKNIDQNSLGWTSITGKAGPLMAVRDMYGSGRSPKEFLRHLWLVAVPENGVNNRYDYPLGLVYLLCLLPFFYVLADAWRRKEFLILPLLAVAYWATWWLGSHQSRFLYIPVLLMILTVLSRGEMLTRLMRSGLVLALALTCLSVLRCTAPDFGKRPWDTLRAKDRKLLEMSATVDRTAPTLLGFHDAAFADFPVAVVAPERLFVLEYMEGVEPPPFKF